MRLVKGKKLAALLLAGLLSIGSMPVIAQEQSVQMPEDINKLIAFGIAESKDTMKAADSTVNRAELALMAIRLHGMDDIVDVNDTTHYFHDVSSDYTEAGYINKAVSFGLMKGVREGYFEPRKAVTGKEALETVVRVLGYEAYVKVRGGEYAQYYSVAAKLKLLKGIEISDKPISRADLYTLFLNSLDAEVLIADGIKDDAVDFTSKSGRTPLTEYHDINTVEGIVTAAKSGSLTNGSTLPEGKIAVDGEIFECAAQWDGYLGYRVNLYYKDNGNVNEAVYIEKEDNEELVLTEEEIVSCNNLTYEYMENGKRKKSINTAGMYVLYNGNAISGNTSDFVPSVGDVTFIDNDGDSDYDVVSIRSYINRMVVSVDNTRRLIYTKTGNPISTEDISRVNLRRENGEKITLADLKLNNVIAIAYDSKGNATEMILCGGEIYGKISSMKNDGSKKYVIEGGEYTVSDALTMAINAGLTEKIGVGTAGTFVYGLGNELVWWEETVTKMDGTAWEFGLLKAAKKETMSSRITTSIFTKTNNFEVMETADSVKIDGIAYKSAADIFAQLCKKGEHGTLGGAIVPQLIRFRCNPKGEIVEIDLAGDETNHGDGLYLSEIAGNTADGVVSSGVQYIKTGLQFYGKRAESDAQSGGGIGIIDEKTEIFICPITNHNMDLSDIKTLKHTLAKDFLEPIGSTKRNENVYCYKVEDNQIANSILCFSGSIETVLDSYADVNIFIGSKWVLDADGNEREQITYLVDDSGEKTLYLADGVSSKNIPLKNDAEDTNTATYTLKSGDLFQFTVDAVGDINLIRPRYDCKNHKIVGTNYDDDSAVTATYRTSEHGYMDIGYAYAKMNGVVKGVYNKNVSADLPANIFSNYLTRKNQKFYIYDAESETIKAGSFDEIMDYSSTNGECDRFIVRHRNWDPEQIFIYKGESLK